MARLGNILFVERDAVYDSAAAFLLARSPRNGAVVSCDGGEAEVRQDSKYVVARFNGAVNAETAKNQGLELSQAGLDLMSIMGTADLLTPPLVKDDPFVLIKNDPEDAQLIGWRYLMQRSF